MEKTQPLDHTFNKAEPLAHTSNKVKPLESWSKQSLFKKTDPSSYHVPFSADNPVELHVELSRHQMAKLNSGEYTFVVPSGCDIEHKTHKRFLRLNCINSDIGDMVKEALDESGVSWQEI